MEAHYPIFAFLLFVGSFADIYRIMRCVAAEWKGITPAATQDQYIGLEDGYV
jgi:hypothetical protein